MSYFPLDRDVLTSSLWAQGSPEAIKVWIYLLLQANPRTGIVDDAAPAIALRCGLPLEVTVQALDWLAAPDRHSRTKDHDGRRIEPLETGGYHLLNYITRRDKDYSTVRVKRWREVKQTATVKRSPTVTETTNKNTDTETDSRKEQPAPLPADVQGEKLLHESRVAKERRFYAAVARLAELQPEKDPPDIARELTGYTAKDGRKVKGVVRPEGLSEERLDRSLEDAQWWLDDLAKPGAKHGT